MTHRFAVKEIALQSGLSTATVDRVLNGRAHVSPQSARRVSDAIDELTRQEAQLAARGRRLFVDIVVEAPQRFSREIRRACETVLPDFRPVSLRPRFSFAETTTPQDCAGHLERIRKRGSSGVCLKARDTAEVRAAVGRLADSRIPVVTIFTDMPAANRLAYAGLDNKAAGRTAAYLMNQWLPEGARTVLTTLSQHSFQGEEDRYQGFRDELLALRPGLELIDASGGGGLNPGTARQVADLLAGRRVLDGVYSMGGGNRAILEALETAGLPPPVYIGHDLDEDNLELLRARRMSVVLHHNLATDMRTAFRHLLSHHGLSDLPQHATSDIQIITPMNIPAPT